MPAILESARLQGCEPLGREKELARLAAAARARRPLLIAGPADSGKTFLAQHFLRSLPVVERARCVYVPVYAGIHGLLAEVAAQLSGEGRARSAAEQSTSGRLRLLLRRLSRERRMYLILDHFPPMSHFLARLVKEWIWDGECGVCLVARGTTRDEIGQAWGIYYAPEYRLTMGPLHEREAKALLGDSIERFGIGRLASAGFRAEVLRRSTGLPGAIVKMCALAADPRYQSGNQVKLTLLHVDYLMRGENCGARFAGLRPAQGKAARAGGTR